MFHIITPIKQVPETSNVKMDESTGTMIRKGVESIINPLDLYSIEVAIQIKESLGGTVTALSMGPDSAAKALKEAIAMGCDSAILISGKEFAGSDTWATSYALAQAISKIGSYDLIIAGERATDGDTGQVGPGIASFLDIPLITYVSSIKKIDRKNIIVERLMEAGYEKYQSILPALLTVVKEISFPRLPTLNGKKKAKTMDIPVWSAPDLPVDINKLGLKGSPTRVSRISRPKITRNGIILRAENETGLNAAVDKLLDFMHKKEIL